MRLKGSFILLLLCLIYSVARSNDSIRTGKRPRVGLVLSGGGAKGIAHIGALKVIEEAGIPIDYIGGTSMGSIIGGLYSLGYTANQLEKYVGETDWGRLLTDRIQREHVSIYEKGERKHYWLQFPIRGRKIELPMGILTGQNVSNLFTELASPAYNLTDFSKFPTPFFCVATDIESGTQVLLEYGNLAKAMRASMAIPSLFTPEVIYGRRLYDGGLINNFPVDVMKDKGLDIIIGVDVSAQPTENDLDNIFKIIEQTVFMASLPLKESNKKLCNVLIIPDIPEYNASSFGDADSLIVRGERAARKQLDQLKAIADSLHKYDSDTMKVHELCPQPLESFFVQNISVKGLKHVSEEFVLQKLELDTMTVISFPELDRGIERLRGTQAFESVVYLINPVSDDGVEIQLNCIERSTNYFRLGLHYDNDYKASLLLNVTFRNALLNNSRASLNLSVGENPSFQLSYFQSPSIKPVGKTLFKSMVSPDWLFQVNGYKFDAYAYSGNKRIAAYTFSSLSASVDLMISPSINSVVGGGIIGDYVAIDNKIGDMEEGIKSNYLYLVYKMFYERDTYNEDYFPTSGNHFRLEGYYAKGMSKETRYLDGLFGVLFRSNFACSFNKRWTAHIGIDAGSVFGTDIPPQYLMYLGGVPDKQLRNHINFVGMQFMQKAGKDAWVFHLNNQVRLWSDIYITFRGNLGKIENELEDLVNWDNVWFGYGVSAQYNSIVGPIGITFASSNATRSMITSINLGFWF